MSGELLACLQSLLQALYLRRRHLLSFKPTMSVQQTTAACIDFTHLVTCSEGNLHMAMAKHSTVKDIRLVLDRFTGAPRGFAFVHFHSVADASRVLHALQVGSLLWLKHHLLCSELSKHHDHTTRVREKLLCSG